MGTTFRAATRGVGFGLLLLGSWVFAPGCFLADECDSSADCGSNERCSDGDCVYDPPSKTTCVDTSEDCSDDPCCDSSDVCVHFSSAGFIGCAASCSSNSGCVSDCCRSTKQGSQVCHPSSYCN